MIGSCNNELATVVLILLYRIETVRESQLAALLLLKSEIAFKLLSSSDSGKIPSLRSAPVTTKHGRVGILKRLGSLPCLHMAKAHFVGNFHRLDLALRV